MAIDTELIDKLLGDYKGPEDLIGEKGLLKELTRALVERALNAELTHHLGYGKHDPAGRGSGNSRNGSSLKTIKGEFGEAEIAVPRDRKGTFEPQLVAKHQTRFTGFDDKILSMYARGMTTREIQGHLEEVYGVQVSPALISEVTDAVLEEVTAWQNRPLEPLNLVLRGEVCPSPFHCGSDGGFVRMDIPSRDAHILAAGQMGERPGVHAGGGPASQTSVPEGVERNVLDAGFLACCFPLPHQANTSGMRRGPHVHLS